MATLRLAAFDFTIDHQQMEKSFHELVQIAETRPDEPEQAALYTKI